MCRIEGGFDGFAALLGEFLTIVGAAFEDFDTIVGVRIVAGGNVDGEVEAHLIETVVDGGGGENANIHVFDTEGFAGGFKILENPFGGFAGVAA